MEEDEALPVAGWSVIGAQDGVTLHLGLNAGGQEQTYQLLRSQAEAIARGIDHVLREK